MSRSIINHTVHPVRQIATHIRQAEIEQKRLRTLQLQGNQSLGLGVLEGYVTINIPTTVNVNVETVSVLAPTDTTIMVGNLMWSMFYPQGGLLVNYDDKDLYKDRLTWEVFMAYDKRDAGSGLLPNQQSVLDTVVADNEARITAKVRSSSTWSIPSGAGTYVIIFYQIRATFM